MIFSDDFMSALLYYGKIYFFESEVKFAKISISQKSGEKEMIHLVLQFAPAVLKDRYIVPEFQCNTLE